ncbi:hypothetical protein [Rathayibacter sp. SD072]|uniref:hypothetical protein n=1 Tax=Rathayibacter sp. SD072 TaxID=2781731 RepID=UPI001A964494|nr:hypothetical protein [Rathayibacter sp. SD072]MBO0984981.1 hypothetical protein [Rathayibacter sp. SD072]
MSGAPAPQRRPVRVWDLVLTVVLLLAEVCATLLLTYVGLFSSMASDGCLGRDDCDFTLLNWGVLIAAGGVWIGMLAALVVSIVLLVRRRIAFWVPIAGTGLSFAATAIGIWMVTVSTD